VPVLEGRLNLVQPIVAGLRCVALSAGATPAESADGPPISGISRFFSTVRPELRGTVLAPTWFFSIADQPPLNIGKFELSPRRRIQEFLADEIWLGACRRSWCVRNAKRRIPTTVQRY
jgi:hypothetical protein